jgi:hypothetical protein
VAATVDLATGRVFVDGGADKAVLVAALLDAGYPAQVVGKVICIYTHTHTHTHTHTYINTHTHTHT